ncbi:MAG TPA: TOBE domain-containing protein [Burkholderiaceae bacterium]|mgnify:CR=1 FL=1|nr:TOBE domain-containing protein [Burkholderiaceae bacterium]
MSDKRDKGDEDGPLELRGVVWMTTGTRNLGGHGRIGLLRAIAETGSITRGAKALGMSYKAAWDAVDTMNSLAGAPLVERSTGGRGGGSTRLTERGRQLIERFERIEEVHARFVRQLSEEALDVGSDFDLLRVLNLKTSARNQFVGVVSRLERGAVNDEVELRLPDGTTIVAIVTRESSETLGLELGATAFALVQASSVMLATELAGARLSARNQLPGTVHRITPGAVNAEVVVDLDAGQAIAAIVTMASLQTLALAPGQRAVALLDASNVILGTLH